MFGLKTFDFVIMILGAVSLLFWLLVFLKGKKYNSMFDNLLEKDYPFKEIYGWGYAFLEMFKYSYKTKSDRKLRTRLDVLYSQKYSEYYLRVVRSQQATLGGALFVFSFILYGLTESVAGLFLGFLFTFTAIYYYGTYADKQIEKRSEVLLHDFSEVVSKLALLTNAGMILKEAWEEIAYASEGEMYKEMRLAVEEMQNGVSEIDAVYNFGTRCMIPEVKKFATTVIQGYELGNRELTMMLQQQNKEVWQLKKQLVRREGEKAASKLLLPIGIMFLGILIIIIVPIFANIGV